MDIQIPRLSFFAPIAIMRNYGVPLNSIIDIGCADGTFGLECQETFGRNIKVLNVDAQLIYEPSLRKIQEKTGASYKITAVSSFNGKINFNISDKSPYWSTISNDGDLVECRTLGSLVKEFWLPAPYVVKMDIEGAEFSVLQGSVEILDDIAAFILETDVFYGSTSRGNFHDIYSFLAARNFSLFDIVSLGYRPNDQVLFQIYSVFLNKKYEFRNISAFFAHGEAGKEQETVLSASMEQRRQMLLARNEEILKNWQFHHG